MSVNYDGLQLNGLSAVDEPMGSPTNANALAPGQYLPGFLMSDKFQMQATVASASPHSDMRLRSAVCGSHARSTNTPNLNTQSLYLGQHNEPVARRLTSPPTQSMWSSVDGSCGVRKKQLDYISGKVKHSTPNGAVGPGSTPTIDRLGANSFLSPRLEAGFTPVQDAVDLNASNVYSPVPLSGSQNVRPNTVMTPERWADMLMGQQDSVNNTQNAEDCWITVFGFPPARSGFILNQFAYFGTIEKHVITNNGNWMHIKYQNQMQVRCALSKNGRVFGDNIMVGVSRCTDPQIITQSTGPQTNGRSFAGDTAILSPSSDLRLLTDTGDHRSLNEFKTPDTHFTPSKCEKQTVKVGRHGSMRSLVATTRSSGLPRTTNVRGDAESGLLSKALGYMFGWS